jgi:hypothetical protein
MGAALGLSLSSHEDRSRWAAAAPRSPWPAPSDPWVEVRADGEVVASARGTDTDGVVVVVAAIVALVAAVALLKRADSATLAWVGTVAFGVCLVAGVVNWLLFDGLADWALSEEGRTRAGEQADYGWGVLVVLGAGLVGTLVSLRHACHLAY